MAAVSIGQHRGGRARRVVRTARVGMWLGWQVESNWTDPLRFLIYTVLRPLGGALILFVMFRVVAGGRGGPMLDYFIVGTAFWPFVLAGMTGMALGIIGDREHYRTLKYIATLPIPWRAYLVGRALSLEATAVTAAALTLLVGWLGLGARLAPGIADAPYLAAALVLGIVTVISLGLLVVSLAMSVSGEAWRLPEAVTAALYLVSGAIFPVSVLPGPMRAVALSLPQTWWLEAMRRGFLGPGAVRSIPGHSDLAVLGVLAVLAGAFLLAGLRVFALAERRARTLGILDSDTLS